MKVTARNRATNGTMVLNTVDGDVLYINLDAVCLCKVRDMSVNLSNGLWVYLDEESFVGLASAMELRDRIALRGVADGGR